MRDSDDQDSYPSSLELPELATPDTSSTLQPSSSTDMEILLQHIDPANPFAFSLEQMTSIVDHKHFEFLQHVGGIEGIAKGLHSNIKAGLDWNEAHLDYIRMFDLQNEKKQDSEEALFDAQFPLSMHDSEIFTQRRQVFGSNVLPTVEEVSLWQLMWESFQDKTLVQQLARSICIHRLTLATDFADHFSHDFTDSRHLRGHSHHRIRHIWQQDTRCQMGRGCSHHCRCGVSGGRGQCQ